MATFVHDVKIARVQRTLQRLEDDVARLEVRVRDLSVERQAVAKGFAAHMIDQARAELERLLEERSLEEGVTDPPLEPAD